MRLHTGTAVALSLFLGLPASAQLLNSGEFRVNSYTTGDQFDAAISSHPTGFVVAWSRGAGIAARAFSIGATPFFVDASVTTAGVHPAVVADTQGRFVVAWETSAYVFAQRYAPFGDPVGPAFRVGSVTTHHSQAPALAGLPDGSFVVAWEGNVSAGDSAGVAFRLFDVGGSPTSADVVVNTYVTGNQHHASVASTGGGTEFMVVWDGPGAGDTTGIFARRFDAAGAPLSGQFRVNSSTTGTQSYPRVAGRPDAPGFVVVWAGYAVGSGTDVFAQRYGADGAPAGGEFRVNTYTTGFQGSVDAAVELDGGFVVVWRSNEDGSLQSVHGRRYAPDGTAASGAFLLNTYTTGDQRSPRVGAFIQGTFVAVYDSGSDRDGSGFGVFGQRFGPRGDVDGSGFVDVLDVFYLINALFGAGAPPVGPADADGNGTVDVLDVFYLINYRFAGGPAPPP